MITIAQTITGMVPDITLVYGVKGGGSISGESGRLIQSQLNSIAKQLNTKPIDIKIRTSFSGEGLDKLENLQASVQEAMDKASKTGKLAATISKIRLSPAATSSFKKQLNDIINTISIDKGVSITLDSKGIGQIKSEFDAAAESAESTTEAVKKQAQAFKNAKSAIGDYYKSLKQVERLKDSADLTKTDAGWVSQSGLHNELAADLNKKQASYNDIDYSKFTKQQRSELLRLIEAKEKDIGITQEGKAAVKTITGLVDEQTQAYKDAKRAITEYYNIRKTYEQDKRYEDVTEVTSDNITSWKSNSGSYENFANQMNAAQRAYDNIDYSSLTAKQRVELETLVATRQKELLLIKEKRAVEKAAAESAEVEQKKLNTQLNQTITLIKQIEKALTWTAAENGSSAKNYQKLTTILEEAKQHKENLSAYLDKPKEERHLLGDNVHKSIKEVSAFLLNANSNANSYMQSIRSAGEATKSFTDHVGGLAQKFTSWLTVSQIIMQVYRAMQLMVTAVIEVDTAMTELRKVTDETEATYEKFLDTAIKRSKQLGATVADTVTATAD